MPHVTLFVVFCRKSAGRVFTDRLRKSIQRDFPTIKFGGLGLGFRVRVLVVVMVWVRVTVGARVMVGVGLVRGLKSG